MTAGIDIAQIAVHIGLVFTVCASVAMLVIALVILIQIHGVVHDILKKM